MKKLKFKRITFMKHFATKKLKCTEHISEKLDCELFMVVLGVSKIKNFRYKRSTGAYFSINNVICDKKLIVVHLMA